MRIHLTDKKCVACEGCIDPLTPGQIAALTPEVPMWSITRTASSLLRSEEVGTADAPKEQAVGGTVGGEGLSIFREFKFKDFKDAMTFANKVGDIAESEGHHPDMEVGWGRVGIHLTTHAINGLHDNDFIVAAKIDALLPK
mgnify:CR=1 FL=1